MTKLSVLRKHVSGVTIALALIASFVGVVALPTSTYAHTVRVNAIHKLSMYFDQNGNSTIIYGYSAFQGWDAVIGVGSPIVKGLAAQIA